MNSSVVYGSIFSRNLKICLLKQFRFVSALIWLLNLLKYLIQLYSGPFSVTVNLCLGYFSSDVLVLYELAVFSSK
ncbi:hypothetical protein WA026_021785 [Henosepilachna vigintioctopunctata]|uniref:Uncharacterized protein n=1 Tax=Henosepilachna vigintioctopunctata TaxID=420089 RepID=A0AAW1TP40_9CUCU